MLGLVRRKPLFIGLDISATAIKLLELSEAGKHHRIESFAIQPLPTGVIVDKAIKNPEALIDALQSIRTRLTSKNNVVAVAVPDSSVITKRITVDSELSEHEVEAQVLIEAEKFIPYPLQEVSLDFEMLGPNPNKPDQTDVNVVASRTENIHSWVNVLAEGGFDVRLVDVESYAVERACRMISQQCDQGLQDKVVAVVDIGSSITNITVLSNLDPVFSREETFGGEQLTKEIQRHYGLSYAEAGLAKKQGTLAEDYAAQILEPFNASAVLQIKRALQFFYSATPFNAIDQIILAGGTTATSGLVQLIESEMAVPTTVANPFVNMLLAPKLEVSRLNQNASAMMICYGLALRSFQ